VTVAVTCWPAVTGLALKVTLWILGTDTVSGAWMLAGREGAVAVIVRVTESPGAIPFG
jgi:hypothetical protein